MIRKLLSSAFTPLPPEMVGRMLHMSSKEAVVKWAASGLGPESFVKLYMKGLMFRSGFSLEDLAKKMNKSSSWLWEKLHNEETPVYADDMVRACSCMGIKDAPLLSAINGVAVSANGQTTGRVKCQ